MLSGSKHRVRAHCAIPLAAALGASIAHSAVLTVGPRGRFARIEDAASRAWPGDTVLVHPLAGNKPYEKTAVYVRRPRVYFRAARREGEARVKISGKGFDYSGRGSTPRAIFQFNRGTDGCLLEGFELFEAHNGSHNGAGVRVNQANHVTVRDCEIRNCDMGMMSNSDRGSPKTMVGLLVERCVIHHNGSFEHPGYNHNLYMGGTSLTLRFCDIHSSLTGHNVKSRAHHVRVEYCYVHDSLNREFDLVDAVDTTAPESHAVLVGNVIAKDPRCKGNKAVVHFGQDGGKDHDGTIYLVHNTIVTPFISPVVDLSARSARAHFVGNIVYDNGSNQRGQKLVVARRGAALAKVTGTHNWLSSGFASGLAGTGIDAKVQVLAKTGVKLPFAGEQDYRLRLPVRGIVDLGIDVKKIALPSAPSLVVIREPKPPLYWQYKHPAGGEERKLRGRPDLGAYEYRRR